MKKKVSYFEKKERRKEVTIAIIILLAVLFGLNYGLFYCFALYNYVLGIIVIGVLNIIFIYLFCLFLGIKFPKRKVPDWLGTQLSELEKKYDEKYEKISRLETKSVNAINDHCPECGNTEREKIVDKIRRVLRVTLTVNSSLVLGA